MILLLIFWAIPPFIVSLTSEVNFLQHLLMDFWSICLHRYFASTFFEPLEARSMFPCFDEPALKATFDITVTYPKGMLAFSNNDVKDKKENGSNSVSSFKTTPKMSTYLVSIVVGDLTGSKEMTSSRGVRVSDFWNALLAQHYCYQSTLIVLMENVCLDILMGSNL